MASSVINYRPQLIKLKKMYIYVTIDWKLKREKALTIEGLFHQFVRTSTSCCMSQQFVRNGKSVCLKRSTVNWQQKEDGSKKSEDQGLDSWDSQGGALLSCHQREPGRQLLFLFAVAKSMADGSHFMLTSDRRMENFCWLKIWFNRVEKWKPSLGLTQDGGSLTRYRFLFYYIVQVFQEKRQNPHSLTLKNV